MTDQSPGRRRVVVLAGPSGSGKSHLAARLGWPVLRLDDFYHDADATDMPRSPQRHHGGGIVDWDDPRSWDLEAAVSAIAELCATGRAEVPVYDLAASRAVGRRIVTTDGPFVAEGLFAPEVVEPCRAAGLLDHALCLRRHRVITFVLRLARDLREARKPPWLLVRRGWRLMRADPQVVAHAVARGCTPVTPRQARRLLTP